MATLTLRRPKGSASPVPDAEATAADRIRRSATEQLARHDEAVRIADIRSGDPIEAAMTAGRGLIEWTAEMAGHMTQAGRPLSAEGERLLVERVASLTAAATRSSTRQPGQSVQNRRQLLMGAGLALSITIAAAAGYQAGVRESLVTLQVRPGEIMGACRTGTIQPASDGQGRVCAVWVRLDQAKLMTGSER